MPYICRNYTNTGLDMLGNPCPCAAGREMTREAGKGGMVGDTMTVHITADDMRPVLDERVRMIMDAHSHEHDAARERIERLERRIERLEALPGVAEALAGAQDEKGE